MTKEECRNEISRLIGQIDDGWILQQIYRCIINITKPDDKAERKAVCHEGI